MDKEQREQLIRERVKAVRGCSLTPLRCVQRRKPQCKLGKRFRNFIHVAVGAHEKEMPVEWIQEKDERRTIAVSMPRRRKGKHPLTKIAEQLPYKLPRVLFDL